MFCLSSGYRIDHMIERVENILWHGQGGSILAHVGTNNADRDNWDCTEILTIGRDPEEDKS